MRIRKDASAAGSPPAKNSAGREIIEWVITLGLAVVLALCVHQWVGQLITVQGPSMQPGLWTNEKVLVGKLEYYFARPKRGDIVIVKYPDRVEDIIKRVIATEGEKIAISDGSVYINGKKLDEPYILDTIDGDMPEQTVPAGTIFVMGDNRNDSTDSRVEGPIPLDKVLGRAYAIVWPVDKWAKLTNYNGTFSK